VKTRHGPSGMSFDDTTNCTEFAKNGRFNPYSVLNEKWFVFFYWASPQPLTTYIFTFPTANHTKHLKKILDGNTILPVMWSARQILMEDQRKETSLLVERDDRGITGPHKITPRDVRLKQTGDNRLIGFMDCLDETMFAMARINHVPPKNRLAEEAARLGYRGRRGKSYLYQGHEWVPIPEDDEKNYWHYPKENKEQNEILNEVQTSDEEGSEETNEQKITNEKENPDNSKKIFSEKNVDPSCIKIEPELWNDPKPDPTKIKNKMLSIEDLKKAKLDKELDSKKEEETKEPESKIENKKGLDKQIIEKKEEDTKAKEIKIDDKKTADNELKAKKGKDKKAPKKGEKAKKPKDKKDKNKKQKRKVVKFVMIHQLLCTQLLNPILLQVRRIKRLLEESKRILSHHMLRQRKKMKKRQKNRRKRSQSLKNLKKILLAL
ncbi:hypothetical protein HW555_005542, partial [Spodoptera exigua]